PLDPARLTVDQSGRAGPGSRVTVDVAYRLATDVPFVGALLGDVTVKARATMRVERRAAGIRRRGWPAGAGPPRPCRAARCRSRTSGTARTTGTPCRTSSC